MFSGSITALVTPFKDGEIDEPAFREFVDWQISEGTNGLVACGTTGETSTLGTTEHLRIVELAIEVANRRVPVIAGIGSNNTASAVYMARESKALGAAGTLAVVPYYNKPGQAGLLQHFTVIANSVDIPMIIYNIPGRSVVDIEVETMVKIASLPQVVGLKDATADLTRVSEYTAQCGPDFIQLSGDDPTALGHWAHGGNGCISVASNIAPKKCAEFHKACAAGDFGKAKNLHQQLDRLFKDLFVEASPAPTKYALSLMGKMADNVRLPLIPCSGAARAQVRAAMAQAGVSVLV